MTNKKSLIIGAVIIFFLLLLLFHSCFRVDVTRKPSTKSLIYVVLDRLGILSERVDQIATDVDTIKVDVRDLKNRKPPRVIYRTIKIVQPAQSPATQETKQPEEVQQPETKQEPPVVSGSIIPGSIPGPQDLVFCIDLEPNKSADSSKKFLFWEICNNLGYNISNVVPNSMGKPANMRLSPGGSADGIMFDGEMLKISFSSLNNWYSQIFGVPMPADFRPGIRSNKSGWATRLMSRSGVYFVYRF